MYMPCKYDGGMDVGAMEVPGPYPGLGDCWEPVLGGARASWTLLRGQRAWVSSDCRMRLLASHPNKKDAPNPAWHQQTGSDTSFPRHKRCFPLWRYTIIAYTMSLRLVERASDGCRPKLHRWPCGLLHLVPRSTSRRGLIVLSWHA